MEEVESIEEKLWKVKLYSNKVFMVKYKNSESFYTTLKSRNSVFSIMNLWIITAQGLIIIAFSH